jgi:uncharacterized protein YoxC
MDTSEIKNHLEMLKKSHQNLQHAIVQIQKLDGDLVKKHQEFELTQQEKLKAIRKKYDDFESYYKDKIIEDIIAKILLLNIEIFDKILRDFVDLKQSKITQYDQSRPLLETKDRYMNYIASKHSTEISQRLAAILESHTQFKDIIENKKQILDDITDAKKLVVSFKDDIEKITTARESLQILISNETQIKLMKTIGPKLKGVANYIKGLELKDKKMKEIHTILEKAAREFIDDYKEKQQKLDTMFEEFISNVDTTSKFNNEIKSLSAKLSSALTRIEKTEKIAQRLETKLFDKAQPKIDSMQAEFDTRFDALKEDLIKIKSDSISKDVYSQIYDEMKIFSNKFNQKLSKVDKLESAVIDLEGKLINSINSKIWNLQSNFEKQLEKISRSKNVPVDLVPPSEKIMSEVSKPIDYMKDRVDTKHDIKEEVNTKEKTEDHLEIKEIIEEEVLDEQQFTEYLVRISQGDMQIPFLLDPEPPPIQKNKAYALLNFIYLIEQIEKCEKDYFNYKKILKPIIKLFPNLKSPHFLRMIFAHQFGIRDSVTQSIINVFEMFGSERITRACQYMINKKYASVPSLLGAYNDPPTLLFLAVFWGFVNDDKNFTPAIRKLSKFLRGPDRNVDFDLRFSAHLINYYLNFIGDYPDKDDELKWLVDNSKEYFKLSGKYS